MLELCFDGIDEDETQEGTDYFVFEKVHKLRQTPTDIYQEIQSFLEVSTYL